MTVGTEVGAAAKWRLADRYELERRIGEGSSADVYAAIDSRFGRPVTVKVFDAAIADDVSLRARFQQQTAKAARLVHPHIAAVLDAGISRGADGSERPFVVTEPAGDESLRSLLRRRGKLSPARAVKLTRQIAAALGYAHQQGVIHADVKPENVIVDATGTHAKLVDFSISFVSARTGAITRQTIARRAAYLAPEQVRGEQVGPQADVYGLGVLLYELLVGRPPFVGGTPEKIAERRVHEAARPAGLYDPYVPRQIERVLTKALERDPAARLRSVADLDAELARIDLSSLRPPTETLLPAAGLAEPPHPPHRSSRRGLFATVVPIVAIGLAIVLIATYLAPALRNAPRLGNLFSGTTIPEVTGMDVERARQLAQSRGIDFIVIGERVSDRTPRGQIMQQAPIPGWEASDQPLRVTVSSGVEVPDVRGRSVENATRALEELGWRVAKVEPAPHPGHPSGTVVLQHPPPGELSPGPGELLLGVAQ